MNERQRVVIDCNILLQALASPAGAAGQCVQLALDGDVQLFLCREIIDEFRDVASRPQVARKLKLDQARVEHFVATVELAATLLEGFDRPFVYERDPDDAIYVNLAISAGARLIVSRDKDLLDLMNASSSEAKDFSSRFPSLRIVLPSEFLEEMRKGV